MKPTLRFLVLASQQVWGIALFLVIWQVWVVQANLNAIVMPRPLSVLHYLATQPDAYGVDALRTVGAALAGLILGLALGSILAIATWLSKVLDGMLLPLGLIFSSVPVVTLIPVIARIVGDGFGSVLAVVTIICFFPAFVFTTAGMRSLPPGSADLFKVLGAGTLARLWLLALPAAAPNWAIAMRITASQAVLAALVAEYLVGSAGLGHIFADTKSEFNMDQAIGVALLGTFISALFSGVASWLSRKINERAT
jgi:ABC-type nitrate/sulfonate/bicarbonate transport system permease component